MSQHPWPSDRPYPSLPPMSSRPGYAAFQHMYANANHPQPDHHRQQQVPHKPSQPYYDGTYHAAAYPLNGSARAPDVGQFEGLRINSPVYQDRFQVSPGAALFHPNGPLPPQLVPPTSAAPPVLTSSASSTAPPTATSTAHIASPSLAIPAASQNPTVADTPTYTPGHWANNKYGFDYGNQPPTMKERISAQECMLQFIEVPRQVGGLKLAGKQRNRYVMPLVNRMKSLGMREREPSALVGRIEETWAEARAQKTEFENRSTGWGREAGDELNMDERIQATWPLYHRLRDLLDDSASANPLHRHDSVADDPHDRANMKANLLGGVHSTSASGQDAEMDEGDLPMRHPEQLAPTDPMQGEDDASESEEDTRGEDEVLGLSKRRQELDARTARRREEEGLGYARNLSIISTSSAVSTTSVADDTSQTSTTTTSKGSKVSPGSIVNPKKRKLGERGKGKDAVEDKLMKLHEQDAAAAKAADERLEQQVAKKALLDRERLDMDRERIRKDEERYLAEVERIKEKEKREEERHKLEVARNEDDIFFSRYERFEGLMRTRTADKAGRFVWGEKWEEVKERVLSMQE